MIHCEFLPLEQLQVEGAVLMGPLTRHLLELGLLPQVTPEFPTFSVSGLGEGDVGPSLFGAALKALAKAANLKPRLCCCCPSF